MRFDILMGFHKCKFGFLPFYHEFDIVSKGSAPQVQTRPPSYRCMTPVGWNNTLVILLGVDKHFTVYLFIRAWAIYRACGLTGRGQVMWPQ